MTKKILDEIKEMRDVFKETKKESEELQNDFLDYFKNHEGDEEDLKTRMEIYLFAYHLLCRSPVIIENDSLKIPLNSLELDFEKLSDIATQFNKFYIFITSEIYDNYSVLNLNFKLKVRN